MAKNDSRIQFDGTNIQIIGSGNMFENIEKTYEYKFLLSSDDVQFDFDKNAVIIPLNNYDLVDKCILSLKIKMSVSNINDKTLKFDNVIKTKLEKCNYSLAIDNDTNMYKNRKT